MNSGLGLVDTGRWERHAIEQHENTKRTSSTMKIAIAILVLICIPIIVGIIIFCVYLYRSVVFARNYQEGFLNSEVQPQEVSKVIKILESYVENLNENYVANLNEGYETGLLPKYIKIDDSHFVKRIMSNGEEKLYIYEKVKTPKGSLKDELIFVIAPHRNIMQNTINKFLPKADIKNSKEIEHGIGKAMRKSNGKIDARDISNLLTLYLEAKINEKNKKEEYIWKVPRPNGVESVTFFQPPNSPLKAQSSDNIVTQQISYLPNNDKMIANLQMSNDNYVNAFAHKDEIFKQYTNAQLPTDDVNKYNIQNKNTKLIEAILDKTVLPRDSYKTFDGKINLDITNPSTVAENIVSDYELYNQNAAKNAVGL